MNSERDGWCESSLEHGGVDNLWSCERIREKNLSDRNGMVAFGKTRERFGKTAGVTKLIDVCQFQWTSWDSLEDKWLRWLKMMRQVNVTALGDDRS